VGPLAAATFALLLVGMLLVREGRRREQLVPVPCIFRWHDDGGFSLRPF
jgi:hypothetical protein